MYDEIGNHVYRFILQYTIIYMHTAITWLWLDDCYIIWQLMIHTKKENKSQSIQ